MSISISTAAAQNAVGKEFAGGKVLRPVQQGGKVFLVVQCSRCHREETLPLGTVGVFISSPKTTVFRCKAGCTNNATETDPNKMSAADYRRTVVEPEFAAKQTKAQTAVLLKPWNKVFRAAIQTGQENAVGTFDQYIANPARRAELDAWADGVLMREGYERMREALTRTYVLDADQYPTFEEYAAKPKAERDQIDADARQVIARTVPTR